MKVQREDYHVRDGYAAFRNVMNNLCDFIVRGVNCNENIMSDPRTSQALRDYHAGKAQAFREVLALFDRYKETTASNF